jgi:hypothetical protein
VRIAYAGQVARMDDGRDHRQVLDDAQPLVSRAGIYLPAGTAWYPQPDRARMTYRIRVDLPAAGFRAIVPGRLLEEHVGTGGSSALFEAVAALPGIDLLGGEYRVQTRTEPLEDGREITLRTYFHPELESFAPAYLQAAAQHLQRYDREIGPHAFGAYSIVSSSLPVGFGMPGIAYLGQAVVRLPFIPATSLRHEVLHDWWGNGVAPRYEQGNWAEGLTTFLADYAYREEQGADAARAMRFGWLRDHAAVRPEDDLPLARFVARRHGADQAVGYNKTAFVFFMLRDRIGTGAFGAALKRFWRDNRLGEAGWKDLQHAFDAQAKTDLSRFFAQWVDRPGAPALELLEASRAGTPAEPRLHLVLRQQGAPYELDVPVRIEHAAGHTDVRVALRGAQGGLDVALPARAASVQIDPDARLFRRLHPDENVPTLRQVLIDPRTRVVIAAPDEMARAAARRVAAAALEAGLHVLEPDADARGAPLFIVGVHAEVAAALTRLGLQAREPPAAMGASASAYAARTAAGRPFAVITAADAGELDALVRPLPHLGAQSYALFAAGRTLARGVWAAQTPRYPVTDRPRAGADPERRTARR